MRAPRDYRWRTSESAAKRMADTVALHQTVLEPAEIVAGRWIAVRLGDGGSDGIAYDSHEAAVRASTNDPSRHAYFKLPLERISPEVCDVLLWYVRTVYDAGWREDPAYQLKIPTRVEEILP